MYSIRAQWYLLHIHVKMKFSFSHISKDCSGKYIYHLFVKETFLLYNGVILMQHFISWNLRARRLIYIVFSFSYPNYPCLIGLRIAISSPFLNEISWLKKIKLNYLVPHILLNHLSHLFSIVFTKTKIMKTKRNTKIKLWIITLTVWLLIWW